MLGLPEDMVLDYQPNVPTEPAESPFALFLWSSEKFKRRRAILQALRSSSLFQKIPGLSSSLPRREVWAQSVLQARELVSLKLRLGWTNVQFQEAFGYMENTVQASPQYRSK